MPSFLTSCRLLQAALIVAVLTLCASAEDVPVKCEPTHCMKCFDVDPTSCESCDPGYVGVAKDDKSLCYLPGACKVDIAHCTGCVGENQDQCGSCTPGYDVFNFKCRAPCDSPACAECGSADRAKCSKCKDGYNLLAVDNVAICIMPGSCSPVPKNCASCDPTNADVCVKCADGYVLIKGECSICEVESCVTCVNGDINKCAGDGCVDGFVNVDGNCEFACKAENCLQCNDTDETVCELCDNGYELKKESGKVKCVKSGSVHRSALAVIAGVCIMVLFSL